MDQDQDNQEENEEKKEYRRKMSNFHLDKETFLGKLRDFLPEVREEASSLQKLFEALNQTMKNDVTFNSLEEVEKYLESSNSIKQKVQTLHKAMKSRAYARIAGK